MKGLEFPIVGAKVKGLDKKFDLSSPQGREKYFQAKCGSEIKKIKDYLTEGTFIAYMIGKKNSGKGTYSQIFTELFGADKIALVSVGDLVRKTHEEWNSFIETKNYERLRKIYRGYISFDEAVDALLGRSQDKLLPTEFILALLKLKIEDLKGKSIFIDGLPREIDQVSYSLYFRDLINYRDDPDVFVLIDIPESVIDKRIKYRVVCPECHNTRSPRLLPTSKIGYNQKTKEFYLICDSPRCSGTKRMISKEGDSLGIDPIRPRLEKDEDIIKRIFSLHGVPKVLLRNHVPVAEAEKYFDDDEITPEYSYSWEEKEKKVLVNEKSWTVKDDNGVESYSLLAAPVVVTLIKQLPDTLGF
jgi:adenylate kinase family enzyme